MVAPVKIYFKFTYITVYIVITYKKKLVIFLLVTVEKVSWPKHVESVTWEVL